MLKFNDYILYLLLMLGFISGCASADKPPIKNNKKEQTTTISLDHKIKKCIVFKNSICTTDVHPQEKMLVTAASDGKVELWHWLTDKKLMLPHQEGVPNAVFNHKGNVLATGSYDNKVRLWDVTTGELIKTFEGHNGFITNLVFSSDDALLASASTDDSVIIWHIATASYKQLSKHEGDVWGLSFSPDDSMLLSGGEDNKINIWNTESGQFITSLEQHTGAVLTLAFSNNGKWLASGGDDYVIKVWDTSNWQVLYTLDDDSYSIYDLEFSANDKLLVSGGRDKSAFGEFLQYHWGYKGSGEDVSIRVWQMETGQIVERLVGHENDIDTLHFTPDGNNLITSSVDGNVIIWSIPSCYHQLPCNKSL